MPSQLLNILVSLKALATKPLTCSSIKSLNCERYTTGFFFKEGAKYAITSAVIFEEVVVNVVHLRQSGR